METLQTLSTALGLGFLTGIRLYATVLGLGIVLRLHWFTLPPALSHLNVLAEPWVMVAAAVACTLEFLADKIPWVDTFWDSFHTIIRPVGAALIGTQILGAHDPATQMALALLCGGVAFAGHSSKAATRLLVNHSPEPVTNVALSLAEDAMVPFGLWLMLKHPLVTCIAVAIFLAIFCWVAPRVFRAVHVEWLAIRSLASRHLGRPAEQGVAVADRKISEAVQSRLVALPEEYAAAVASRANRPAGEGVFCAAGHNVSGLKNSIGYLCFVDGGVLFVTKRLFRYRVYDVGGYSEAQLIPGLLFDTFRFETEQGRVEFDAFKSRKPVRASGRPALSHP